MSKELDKEITKALEEAAAKIIKDKHPNKCIVCLGEINEFGYCIECGVSINPEEL